LRAAGHTGANLGTSNMSKFYDYEKEYKTDKAKLVSSVQALARVRGNEKKGQIKKCEDMFVDDNDMIEAMENEISSLSGASRTQAATRLGGYKSESRELRNMMNQEARNVEAEERDALFATENAHSDSDPVFSNQRQKLMNSSSKLNSAREEMNDTLDVAGGIMTQLHDDRQKILNIKKNASRADESLSRSGAIMRRIRNADIKERIMMAVMGIVLIAMLITVLYFVVAG